MTIFHVRHITRYRYRKPVRLGRHELMFRPRDSYDQRLLDCNVKISPEPASVRWIHDAFGNCVTLVEFDTSTTELTFDGTIKLDHTPENSPDFQIEDYARSHPFSYGSEELPDLAAYIRRQYRDDDGVDRWLDRFISRGELQPTGRLLMTLNEAIAQGFSYQRRSTPGTQEPALTLRVQSGSCRDFALLMMEAARSLGFAARFVSGYIYVPDRDGARWLGGGSTHAWCQVYVPGSGWIEFDPTNGIVGNRDLIRVAVARMPSQAVPLSGRYWGSADDELGIEVEVNVKTERDRAIP
jgi:transglutaminase-like putative cysteine protease